MKVLSFWHPMMSSQNKIRIKLLSYSYYYIMCYLTTTNKPMTHVATNAIDQEKKRTPLSVILAVTSYLSFLVILLWFVAFLIPKASLPDFLSFVPTLDSAPQAPWILAILIDLGLISLFGTCHSLFARPALKQWMNLPKRYERTFFMIQANTCLAMLMVFWRNFDGPSIWDVTSAERASYLVAGFNLFGVLFLVSSTFAFDHFHLFGLTQGTSIDLNKTIGLAPSASSPLNESKEQSSSSLNTRWHYQMVAHPIILVSSSCFGPLLK